MSVGKRSAEQAVSGALSAAGELTVVEIAGATGLGRSTVGKVLSGLERSGRARRRTGGREGARRLPDRWSTVQPEERPRSPRGGDRLRAGELDALVLDYLNVHHAEGPLGPTAIAKGLGRSSGAVGNCLARLAAAGRVRKAGERPRRYSVR